MKDTISKVVAFLALLGSPLAAQTVDSTVCKACILDKVDTTAVLMKVDTVPVVVRFDSVYATKYDSTFRDSTVKVTLPPVPGLLATHFCNTKVENGFTDRGDAALSIVSDRGGSVCQATFRAGMNAGNGPVQIDRIVNRSGVLTVGFWLKVSSNWVGHPSKTNKVIHVFVGGHNRVVLALVGSGSGPLKVGWNMQGQPYGTLLPSSTYRTGTGTLARNQWGYVELSIRVNDPGQSNGFVDLSLDGKPVGSWPDLRWLADTVKRQWEIVRWNPTWGGTAGSIQVAQYMWVDDLGLAIR